MTDITLGIDPGRDNGAAVWGSSPRMVVAVVTWHRLRPSQLRQGYSAYRCVTWCTLDGETRVDEVRDHYTMPVAEVMLHCQSVRVCIEGLFQRQKSIARLAESVGELQHTVRPWSNNAFDDQARWRPTATTWRQQILGCTPPSARAKQVAMTYVDRVMPHIPEDLRRIDHVAEAACIMSYGARLGLLERKRKR